MVARLLRAMVWTSVVAWIVTFGLVVVRLTPTEEPPHWAPPLFALAVAVASVATIGAVLAYVIPSTFQAWSDGFEVGRRVEHRRDSERPRRHLTTVR